MPRGAARFAGAAAADATPPPLRGRCLTQEGTLLNGRGEAGGKVLTLTGWVALVAMFGLATVTLGGAVYLGRRFWGPTRGYTMVLKHAPPEGSPAR